MTTAGQVGNPLKNALKAIALRLDSLPLLAPFLVGLSVAANALAVITPNYDVVTMGKTAALALAVCAVIVGACRWAFPRSASTAAFAACLSVILISYFNAIEAQMLQWLLNSPFRFMARVVPIILLMSLLYAAVIWFFSRKLAAKRWFNLWLNLAALAMINVPVALIARAARPDGGNAAGPTTELRADAPLAANNKPDIYLIILDAYTSPESIKTYYGYDNDPFVSHLRSNNFHVATNAKVTAIATPICIAALLDMEEITPEGGREYLANLAIKKLANAEAPARLRKAGYDIINMSFLRFNQTDNDYEYKAYFHGVFDYIFQNSLAGFIAKLFSRNNDIGQINHAMLDRIIDIFQDKNKPPTFVYAHIMMPHPPYLYDRHGKRHAFTPSSHCKQGYLEQYIYCTKLVSNMVNTMIADNNRNKIVLFQGDHGSRMLSSPQLNHLESHTILNALYLPGSDPSWFWEGMRPVDTFRLIFNKYFGANYPYLSRTNGATFSGSASPAAAHQ